MFARGQNIVDSVISLGFYLTRFDYADSQVVFLPTPPGYHHQVSAG